MLQNLFAAVAPGSLWPVDVLLRVLFCDVDQASVANSNALKLSQSEFVCLFVLRVAESREISMLCQFQSEKSRKLCTA